MVTWLREAIGRSMNKENIEKHLSDHALAFMVVILGVAVAASLIAVGVYVATFHGHPLATAPDRWGQFGDFLGGALNPVFGFLSVLALLVALVLQNRELRLSTEELRNSSEALRGQNRAIEHQNFEQTFFAWLRTYRELLDSVSHYRNRENATIELRGREALRVWWHNAVSPFGVAGAVKAAVGEGTWDETFRRNPTRGGVLLALVEAGHQAAVLSAAMRKWESLYKDEEYQLDSLFRNLYRLIYWINSQDSTHISPAQKWLYVSIVRAQLSWIELVYLYYNGLTQRGANFKELIERYALFDNLTFESDQVISILKTYPPDGVGYRPSAYDSVLARDALGLPESTEATLRMAASRA